jgi:hypothetical protein
MIEIEKMTNIIETYLRHFPLIYPYPEKTITKITKKGIYLVE